MWALPSIDPPDTLIVPPLPGWLTGWVWRLRLDTSIRSLRSRRVRTKRNAIEVGPATLERTAGDRYKSGATRGTSDRANATDDAREETRERDRQTGAQENRSAGDHDGEDNPHQPRAATTNTAVRDEAQHPAERRV